MFRYQMQVLGKASNSNNNKKAKNLLQVQLAGVFETAHVTMLQNQR